MKFIINFLLVTVTFCVFLHADSPYLLHNSIIAASSKSAIIEDTRSLQQYLVTVGDHVDKYVVKEIKPHRVTLESSSRIITLFLHSRFVSTENNHIDCESKQQPPPITFQWPSEQKDVISGFGYRQHPLGGGKLFHKGIDLPLSMHTPIYASSSGIVKFAGRRSTYGILLILSHPEGYQTRYAHLSKITVNEGDLVSRGDKVAYSGNTGRSTGPHLHFEVRKDGVPVDPEKYLPNPE